LAKSPWRAAPPLPDLLFCAKRTRLAAGHFF